MPARLARVYVGPMCGTACPERSEGAVRVVTGSCPAESKKRFNLERFEGPVKSPLAEASETHDFGSFLAAQIPVGADMVESDRLGKFRHDLSNPLSALLAEIQLLLLNESQFDAETLTSLKEIEALAIRMRGMLREI
jgi:hypothetical protein